MTFSEIYGSTTFQLHLRNDGKVDFVECCGDPHGGGAWSGGPSNNLRQCTHVLDCIGSRSPNVYRKVYEHIQHQQESCYVSLANYCKKKNNELLQEFQMID